MVDDILPVQQRIEAVKARLPQLAAGLDPRQASPTRMPPPVFLPAPRQAEPVETQRAPTDPSFPKAASLRRFSSNLPVAPPAVLELPERTEATDTKSARIRRAATEIDGENASSLQPPRFPAGAPGAAYHVETSATSSVSEDGRIGSDPPPIERRHALVAIPASLGFEQAARGGHLWLTVLIGVALAALLLLR